MIDLIGIADHVSDRAGEVIELTAAIEKHLGLTSSMKASPRGFRGVKGFTQLVYDNIFGAHGGGGIIWHPLSVNGVVEGEVFAMSGLEAFSIA